MPLTFFNCCSILLYRIIGVVIVRGLHPSMKKQHQS
ncbi:hypothetical protein Leryth_023520 [Lithospermum erythrorhizon]|nr:hypothetical protein Leryth_023520 [Lithospermum erythrorhizon]